VAIRITIRNKEL